MNTRIYLQVFITKMLGSRPQCCKSRIQKDLTKIVILSLTITFLNRECLCPRNKRGCFQGSPLRGNITELKLTFVPDQQKKNWKLELNEMIQSINSNNYRVGFFNCHFSRRVQAPSILLNNNNYTALYTHLLITHVQWRCLDTFYHIQIERGARIKLRIKARQHRW